MNPLENYPVFQSRKSSPIISHFKNFFNFSFYLLTKRKLYCIYDLCLRQRLKESENVSKTNARVAQLVERDLAKVEAAGSSPVSRFSYALELVPGLFCCLYHTKKRCFRFQRLYRSFRIFRFLFHKPSWLPGHFPGSGCGCGRNSPARLRKCPGRESRAFPAGPELPAR